MESSREFEAHLQLRGAVIHASGANRSDAATADAANAAAASRSPSDSSDFASETKSNMKKYVNLCYLCYTLL
jgi:hypothetical protein